MPPASPPAPATPPPPRVPDPAPTAAQPAAYPPAASPPSPRRAPLVWRLLLPAVSALAGVLFATSFQTAQGGQLRSDRGLPGLIETANRDVAAKGSRVAALEAEIVDLTASAAPGAAQVTPLTARAEQLDPVVGTGPVSGPGLTVTLSDSPRQLAGLPPSIRADDLVVHQQDVQAVVNALWRGGAEAMTIQDQRVIATSAVRCVGNTLILQGRVYSTPFVVTAVGPVDAMTAALDRDPQVTVYREWSDAVGLGYQVTSSTRLDLPGFTGSLGQLYAKVAG